MYTQIYTQVAVRLLCDVLVCLKCLNFVNNCCTIVVENVWEKHWT